ncbi:hypothetical protein HOU35_gp105 [Acinetobacter phage vB_AbaM_B09_Aci05]|uniref:Uncharacterized protein n=2 Tax=Saclayvirus TaxID=2733128 RepID=A0A386KLH8_9CAUD|nr:hypothetical protein HOU30_gp116 [Acinetobacter phage vB_AbaM_B09_Aci02-2]YP_009813926.1 hypothetical protein HOU35_gp105 [Acinetobacter phage vB_AbaM_B09_Aci05]AZF88473.1 hypothetical protein TAC_0085 [Acinetobacter phage TAC1]QMP19090.1 hypothetical protein FKOIJHOC_00142 [Acinetobacter phage Ab_121]QQV88772.1 hypothetical protein Liucustia_72 [Acinetobacter phage Liucustia]UYL86275.1 tail terminator [Acinetobacter phage vB_AbaM_CP14]AYD82423.1 hypothetical protein Aci05_072 [Acinetobact
MEASVNISSNELKRLFHKAVKDGGFSERVISETVTKLLDRVARDYPHLLKGIYQNAHRKYQASLALGLKQQRERNMKQIYGGKYGN